ncbi:MAG TPA: PEP/pyruvate-binding domain-containing protein [Actinomycetota bacterium]|nr:PEP/pyruvate-binding domain-containing protein [Actinomycetota bacterium]
MLGAPPEQVGGKAASLGRLTAAGIPVPPFFVVTSAAFELHLAVNGIRWPASDDPGSIQEAIERITAAPIPAEVRESLVPASQALLPDDVDPLVAVRSSGATEDSAPASFAGQFTTALNVPGDRLTKAVQECWASSLSATSLAYRRTKNIGLGAGPAFAVVVQAQVFPDKAGVLFTRHPLEPDGDAAYLEANFGTGESVVGGMVTPDSYTLSRSTGAVLESRIGSKKRITVVSKSEPGSRVVDTEPFLRAQRTLSAGEAERLLALGLKIEDLLGQPQDIEWAIDESGLWVLQARPQTGAMR